MFILNKAVGWATCQTETEAASQVVNKFIVLPTAKTTACLILRMQCV